MLLCCVYTVLIITRTPISFIQSRSESSSDRFACYRQFCRPNFCLPDLFDFISFQSSSNTKSYMSHWPTNKNLTSTCDLMIFMSSCLSRSHHHHHYDHLSLIARVVGAPQMIYFIICWVTGKVQPDGAHPSPGRSRGRWVYRGTLPPIWPLSSNYEDIRSDAVLTSAILPITGRLVEGGNILFLPVQIQRTCPLPTRGLPDVKFQ